MGPDDLLAARIERIVEWNGHLRPSEQADLRDAAERLRTLGHELEVEHRRVGAAPSAAAGD